MKYTIIGTPRILKNSKQISRNWKTGRSFIRKSDNAEKAQKGAIQQLCPQRRGTTWDCPIHVKFTYYGAWSSTNPGNIPDLSNLAELPADSLTKAGVISDDRIIESLDGSRRVRMCDTCDRRGKYVRGDKAGQYKDDCGAKRSCAYERTEIEIREYLE